MKIRAAVPVLAALMMAPSIWAQAGAPAPSKVAVISMQTAILSTAEGKEAAAQLQSQFAPRQTELQGLQKQIEDDQNRLRTGQTTLSDDEQARLTNEYNVLTRNFQRKTQDAQDDYTASTQELVNRIGRKMVDILTKYSKENNFAVVLDSSSQQTPIVFAANQLDITQDIVRLYDQSYPVKTSSTAPAPSKPAAAPRAAPAPKP